MAETYETRSGKATRQRYEKGRRDRVVQVRMSDEEFALMEEKRGTRSRSNFLRGRMSYTEFGEGKRRREHLKNGTDRIAAQMGDAPSREDFVTYCENQTYRHPNAVNQGYEVRVSWATDELNPNKPDDVQRAMEYAYLLCHELAPDSPCWVTMHVDGEGGCVHAHATIANHDLRTGQVINKDDTSLYAPRVQAVNDRLSREMGFQVLGADRDKSVWAERRDTFDYDSFDRHLGDKVASARDRSNSLDEFKRNLGYEGVTLKETSKTDKKTGEVTTGWSYKAVDEWGPKRRTRKRRASNLADDLTKEGVEAYFEEKQRQAEAQAEAAQTQPEPATEPEVAVEEPTHQEREDSPADSSFGTYFVTESDVEQMAGDLQRAHIGRSREQGKPFAGERYDRLMEAERHPDEQLARLRAEVDAARADFRASKRQVEELRRSKCPTLLQGAWLLAKTGCDARDPVSRMMADMTAMMLREMIRQFMQEQLERRREEAERRLYESRANMWDVEKRLKAAEKAVGDEDERERRLKAKQRDRALDMRLGNVTKRQAEDDAQYQ